MSRRRERVNTSLFVKNFSARSRPEDLRRLFEKYGRIKDVYMPRDYYTGEPRGFAYVQFFDIRDAEDAREAMDRTRFEGRELTVLYAEGERKNPREMRNKEQGSRRRGRSPRHRSRSRSRSPLRGRRSPRTRSRSRSLSRSRSPHSPSASPGRSRARRDDSNGRGEERKKAGSRASKRSPSRSPSPRRNRSPSRSRSRSPPRQSVGDKAPLDNNRNGNTNISKVSDNNHREDGANSDDGVGRTPPGQ